MLLVIDNYDSFTYNIVQYLQELGAQVRVVKNDELGLAEIDALAPSKIVVSPGPCSPNEAGISMPLIKMMAGRIPILGVCLGHQCIAQVFGAKVVRAKAVMHGKTSKVYHENKGVFDGLEAEFIATRYHSLVVDRTSLPAGLEVTAWTQNADGGFDEVMGLRHKNYDVEGVQFHPESILSECGHSLLSNFLNR